MDDWLLDVRLAHGEFRTEQASIWLNDLGLGPEFADIVQSMVNSSMQPNGATGLNGF